MNEINLKVDTIGREVIVRKGEAMPAREPIPIEIDGNIDAPSIWMTKRRLLPDSVVISRDDMTITYNSNDGSYYRTQVIGRLELSRKLKEFGINEGNYITPLQMAEFIKMNRACFENRQQAMNLVTQLRAFKAQIDRKVEMEVDPAKGNKKALVHQIVESNMPESFNIMIPIFKGMKPQMFNVEVYFNPDDLTCTLVSPEVAEIVEETRDLIIDEQKKIIEDLAPDIAIIEK